MRHARAVTGLALRLGVMPRAPRVEPRPVRSLEEIALDNASEGCGREAFGAVLNAWQAEHASVPEVREVMGAIAADEHAHARASFELAEVLSPRLTPAQRRRAREAQENTVSRLAADEVPEVLRRQLGLMDAEQVARTSGRLLDAARV